MTIRSKFTSLPPKNALEKIECRQKKKKEGTVFKGKIS